MNEQLKSSSGEGGLKGSKTETQSFRVATWNLENYQDTTAKKGCIKSVESKIKIRECIRRMNPDVIALQEIGSKGSLDELRASLASEECEFPYWEYVQGEDADLHVSILSKFPFAARRPHTQDCFVMNGHTFHVRRGFAEIDIRVNPHFSLTLFAAHLKSKNENAEVLSDDLRLEEARLLREKIDARLRRMPDANILVCGDFNDTEDSMVVRTIVGIGEHQLVDSRPASNDGRAAWTNYYEEKDRFERIDYVLMSNAMEECWLCEKSCVWQMLDWRMASDHRPVVAAFANR
jgi:endonuclease/exonuclease/phosphatase family metal-dependent hydrolase